MKSKRQKKEYTISGGEKKKTCVSKKKGKTNDKLKMEYYENILLSNDLEQL